MDSQCLLSRRSHASTEALQQFGFRAVQNPSAPRVNDEAAVDLSVAENWCIRSEMISLFQEAVLTGLNDRRLSYSNSYFGDTELIEALASFFNQYFQPYRPVEPAHLAIGPGSSACLDALMHHICDPGEGVLVPVPFWNGFDFHFTIRAGVQLVEAQVDTLHNTTDPDVLIAALTQAFDKSPCRIRALVITNPGNPLGQCYSQEALRRCAQFCQQLNLHLVCDELYALSCFRPDEVKANGFTSILSLDLESCGVDPSRVHTVWSLSKDFGCSGLRLGCTISQANPTLLLGLCLPMSSEVSSLTALCTTSLLTSPELPRLIRLNTERLLDCYRLLTNFLDSRHIDYIPVTAGLFVFARLMTTAKSWDDEANLQQCLRREGLLVSPGKLYHLPSGQNGWFRLTFAIPKDQLSKAVAILACCL
ncbi:hypothetical protein Asppvi_005333 [Aspergillus pseudoviridinutans]|uniref:Aminotransferase class I/classII large domain-containing protein n=1 Tax=Aspergillus pseudoviridinutans TaxID=1517512 RepID=A0A9P3BEG2_9EURO|nr:uncharacterized protein Asppvi_005333 [Aspergillus pseudoviridinutans]GIJ86444.1 hypothetical protein Asppvi_005333 [Aspergillus pseudoviridinutans]